MTWARSLPLAAALLVASACGGGGDEPAVPDALEDRQGLTPVYDTTTTVAAGGSSSTAQPTVPSTVTSTPAPGTGREPSARPSASVADPVGDPTTGLVRAPGWADLAGATLGRPDSDYFELRVRFAEPAPTSSGGADRTMNVALFMDVDGDGRVDYEVWANLADGGWDGSWFDDRSGTAAFSDEAAIDVLVERGELIVRFPPQYVGEATRFRWSIALEYGTYALLGTNQTTRDDAPDRGEAVDFPQ